jgi:hypothetical protein
MTQLLHGLGLNPCPLRCSDKSFQKSREADNDPCRAFWSCRHSVGFPCSIVTYLEHNVGSPSVSNVAGSPASLTCKLTCMNAPGTLQVITWVVLWRQSHKRVTAIPSGLQGSLSPPWSCVASGCFLPSAQPRALIVPHHFSLMNMRCASA